MAVDVIPPLISGFAGLLGGALGSWLRRGEDRKKETREEQRARRSGGEAQAKRALEDLEAFISRAANVHDGPIPADLPEWRTASNACELVPDDTVLGTARLTSLTVAYWDLAWDGGDHAVAEFWASNARRHALDAVGLLRSALQQYARGEPVSDSLRIKAQEAQKDASQEFARATDARRARRTSQTSGE